MLARARPVLEYEWSRRRVDRIELILRKLQTAARVVFAANNEFTDGCAGYGTQIFVLCPRKKVVYEIDLIPCSESAGLGRMVLGS